MKIATQLETGKTTTTALILKYSKSIPEISEFF